MTNKILNFLKEQGFKDSDISKKPSLIFSHCLELMQKYADQQLILHDVMCCSFCKEEIKFGEHEYMHKEGCGCMDDPNQNDEEFHLLDTGHTVTNGYPLE
jgi:hypothetical protein